MFLHVYHEYQNIANDVIKDQNESNFLKSKLKVNAKPRFNTGLSDTQSSIVLDQYKIRLLSFQMYWTWLKPHEESYFNLRYSILSFKNV